MNPAPMLGLLTALAMSLPSTGGDTVEAKPSLTCNTGPVTKALGGANWLVYSCSDNHTVILTTAPGNPAMPYIFSMTPGDKGYEVHGEGTGSTIAADATYTELRHMKKSDVEALIDETRPHALNGQK